MSPVLTQDKAQNGIPIFYRLLKNIFGKSSDSSLKTSIQFRNSRGKVSVNTILDLARENEVTRA